ncbi:hypothetical protein D3C81_09540 [compost metagenome]
MSKYNLASIMSAGKYDIVHMLYALNYKDFTMTELKGIASKFKIALYSQAKKENVYNTILNYFDTFYRWESMSFNYASGVRMPPIEQNLLAATSIEELEAIISKLGYFELLWLRTTYKLGDNLVLKEDLIKGVLSYYISKIKLS